MKKGFSAAAASCGADVASRLRARRRRHGRAVVAGAAVLAVIFAAVLAGCAGGASSSAGDAGANKTPASAGTKLRWFGEFKEAYPNEYASFVHGGVVKDDDGQVHSHAATRFHAENSPKLQDQGAVCLSCKTAEFNDLYEKYGDDLYDMAYNDVAGEVSDFFSCRTCHESGNPEDGAGAVMKPYVDYAQPLLSVIDAQTAACAQCHNSTCDNARYIIGKNGKTVEDVGPYRYGFDADSLKKAALEDGVLTGYDEKVGVDIFYLGHPDGELFYGSTHEKQGLTCVSCHMPEMTDESGNTYRSHDSSGSPYDKEASMKFCLTCHADQGITDTVAMRAFIREKQAEMAALEEAAQADVAALGDEIAAAAAAGSVDAATLDAAREAYADATYYLSFQHAGARTPGGKVAHAGEAMRAYVQRAVDLVADARQSVAA